MVQYLIAFIDTQGRYKNKAAVCLLRKTPPFYLNTSDSWEKYLQIEIWIWLFYRYKSHGKVMHLGFGFILGFIFVCLDVCGVFCEHTRRDRRFPFEYTESILQYFLQLSTTASIPATWQFINFSQLSSTSQFCNYLQDCCSCI